MSLYDVLALCKMREDANPYGDKHIQHPTWVLVSDVRIAAEKEEVVD